jgi:regulator of protease activity HflC (stomatin/prohibitin superfamily)
METLAALLRQLGQLFTWWVTVAPWERGLRVRAGRHVKRLAPGLHLKLPFLDATYVQSVRLRIAHQPMQTVMTQDRKALMVAAAVGYAVADVALLYQTLHHAQDTISNLAMMAIAEAAAAFRAEELTPDALSRAATARLKFDKHGLEEVTVRVTDFALVRTYRLVTDQRWGGSGDQLNVERAQP